MLSFINNQLTVETNSKVNLKQAGTKAKGFLSWVWNHICEAAKDSNPILTKEGEATAVMTAAMEGDLDPEDVSDEAEAQVNKHHERTKRKMLVQTGLTLTSGLIGTLLGGTVGTFLCVGAGAYALIGLGSYLYGAVTMFGKISEHNQNKEVAVTS